MLKSYLALKIGRKFNSISLIKRGGGTGPMKPGNRQIFSEKVPIPAKYELWQIREHESISAPFCSLTEGAFICKFLKKYSTCLGTREEGTI